MMAVAALPITTVHGQSLNWRQSLNGEEYQSLVGAEFARRKRWWRRI